MGKKKSWLSNPQFRKPAIILLVLTFCMQYICNCNFGGQEMKQLNFSKDWQFSLCSDGKTSGFFSGDGDWTDVELPHDYTRLLDTSPDALDGPTVGFYPNVSAKYRKCFEVPEKWTGKQIQILFEGIMPNAEVALNGNALCCRPNGYTAFTVDLTHALKAGQENELKVTINNSGKNSRWYAGAGINRYVWLLIGDACHIPANGIFVHTEHIAENGAKVVVDTEMCNRLWEDVPVVLKHQIKDQAGVVVAADELNTLVLHGETQVCHRSMFIPNVTLWDCENPYLYTLSTELWKGGEKVEEVQTSFGVREVTVDAVNGFCLNGKPLKLRGACIHDGNGILGSECHDRSELRKIRALKEAGFNAIRKAHNPSPQALLNACDREGMLLMEEAFDMWNVAKNPYDYHIYFQDWWERDIISMVRCARNHPSVVMYSIGNEIVEQDGLSYGAKWSRTLAEKVRALDHTRPVTAAATGIPPTPGEFAGLMMNLNETGEAVEEIEMTFNEDFMSAMANLGRWAPATEDFAGGLDIVGYNYMDERYEKDGSLFPNRVICGTESKINNYVRIWNNVSRLPYVIGDFCWPGYDYIGEAGMAQVSHEHEVGFFGDYPWRYAGTSDINACGGRRPQSYWREIIWGRRTDPYIVTFDPVNFGKPDYIGPWGFEEAVRDWTWPGQEGKRTKAAVYSPGDHVVLYLNGRQIGEAEVQEYKAYFELDYEPGVLEAEVYQNGKVIGRDQLHSTKEAVRIGVYPETDAWISDEDNICYVNIVMEDDQARCVYHEKRTVEISVTGAGTLIGFGTANPMTMENYGGNQVVPYEGRVQAVIRCIRGTEPVVVTVCADGFDTVRTEIIPACMNS